MHFVVTRDSMSVILVCHTFLLERIRLQIVWLTARHRHFSEEDETSTFLTTDRGDENRWFDAVAAPVVRLTTTHWHTAEIWVRNANCSYNAANKRQAGKYQLGCLESPVNLIIIISGKLWKRRNTAGSQAAKSEKTAFAFVHENMFCLNGGKRLRPFITATVLCFRTHNPSKTSLLN